MAKNFTICVGTLGMGLWRSTDGGKTWGRGRLSEGYQGGRSIFGLTLHPKDSSVVYAGVDDGVYRSEDRGRNFERLDSPMNGMRVWRIAIDPVDPNTVFAGTAPAALFRSRDGGAHWEKLSADFAEECANVSIPRVTALVVSPSAHRTIWAGVEVDGVRRSLDGGDTWTRIAGGLLDEPDIHDIKVIGSYPTTVLVTLPREIVVSTDTGESWRGLGVGSHFALPYCRSVVQKEDDPSVIFAATGDDALGGAGAIQRSMDGGQTWEQVPLPVPPNTHIESFATHPADPDLILACSHYGQLFATSDGGDWWIKLPKEFTEVRGALAWFPN
jgi:photosystem II stability/assembly factor-like uncharacterized protein